MKRDIENKEDIKLLVNTFYEKVNMDVTISHFFSKVVPVNWETHLPVMYNFWENIIFHTGGYTGNPMEKHMQIQLKCPMMRHHFEKWIELFNKTVDELFEGERAFQTKQRALSIATVMQIKIAELPGEQSIY